MYLMNTKMDNMGGNEKTKVGDSWVRPQVQGYSDLACAILL